MFILFASLGALMFFATPVLLILSIIFTALKKKPVIWWSICGGCFILFFVFELIAYAFSCKHDYKLVEEVAATCTEDGYSKYHCDKCDQDKIENIDKLGHVMKITSRIEPTENLVGEIVRECSRCGYEEVETIAKLEKKEETSKENTQNNSESSSSISSPSSENNTETTPSESTSNNDAYNKPSESLDNLIDIDNNISSILVEKGYSIEHATAIEQILNTLGIQKIKIESMTGTPEKGLNGVVCYPNDYTSRDRRFSFTTENGILFYAGFLDEDLYDSEKGGYLKNYNDVHVPKKEVSLDTFNELQQLAKE